METPAVPDAVPEETRCGPANALPALVPAVAAGRPTYSFVQAKKRPLV